jgi:hypothetical protein
MNRTSLAAAVATVLLVGCATEPLNQEQASRAVEGYIEDVNKLSVVDCLLPGQLRKLGAQATYLSGRRPIRTTQADCEVRGGEYVAYDRANYASALKVWLSKAEEGDATAQLYVGQIYEKGLGQAPDYKAAANWYRKAAAQGNSQAQINLGALYEKGLGVPQSSATAAEWYGKASGLDTTGIKFAAAVPAPASTVLASAPPSNAADKEELERLRASVERSQREAEALRQKLAAAERSQTTATQAVKSSNQPEVDELRRAAERSQRESEELKAQLDAAKRENAQVAARSEREKAALREQLGSVEQQAQSSEREKAALREQLGSTRQGQAADSESLRLAAERSRREAEELRAQLDAARQQMLQQQEELRGSQDELDKLREQLAQQKAATPAAAVDDPKVRELEAALKSKESMLKSQQANINKMAATFEKERRKLGKELVAAKQQKAQAQPAQAAASTAPGNPAKAQLAQAENDLNTQMEEYRKGSAELTGLLTSQGGDKNRAQIDQRKAQLQGQSKEIGALKEKVERLAAQSREHAASEMLAQAGPNIEIIEPPVTLTRGIRVVQVNAGAKDIVGKVQMPGDLKSLIINGKPVSADAAGLFRFPATAQAGGTPVNIVATDKRDRTSRLELNVMAAVPEVADTAQAAADTGPAVAPGDINFGKFYALIIGNSTYTSTAYPALQTPANDAKSVDVILRERYGFSTKLLLNATRYQIMTALNEIHRKLGPNDNLLIYYAGHGEIDKSTQMAYWLPVDADAGNSANWISSQSITEFISIMPAKHVMVVADSCYSGALAGSAVAKLPEGMDAGKREKWLKVMATRKARTVLTSGGVQPVLDQGGGGHSVFANAFLDVLRGNKRVLEDYDVFRSVAGQVKSSASKAGFDQSPQYAPLQHAGHEGSPFFFVPEKV